jgi:hypothetical protein
MARRRRGFSPASSQGFTLLPNPRRSSRFSAPLPARRLDSIGRSPLPLLPTSRRAPRSGRISDLCASSLVARRCDPSAEGAKTTRRCPRALATDDPSIPFSASVLMLVQLKRRARPGHAFDPRCSCPSSSILAKPLHTATSPPAPLRSSASRAAARTSSASEAPSDISSRISTSGLHRAAGVPPPMSLLPSRPHRNARLALRRSSIAPRSRLLVPLPK